MKNNMLKDENLQSFFITNIMFLDTFLHYTNIVLWELRKLLKLSDPSHSAENEAFLAFCQLHPLHFYRFFFLSTFQKNTHILAQHSAGSPAHTIINKPGKVCISGHCAEYPENICPYNFYPEFLSTLSNKIKLS